MIKSFGDLVKNNFKLIVAIIASAKNSVHLITATDKFVKNNLKLVSIIFAVFGFVFMMLHFTHFANAIQELRLNGRDVEASWLIIKIITINSILVAVTGYLISIHDKLSNK